MTIPNSTYPPWGAAAKLPGVADAPQGFAGQEAPARANTVPAQIDVEEQETLQSARVTSALLSSLMGTEGRFFSAPSPRALTARGQFPTQHPNIALLETAQYGRETSALLSSIMSPPALKPQGNSVFIGQPSIQNSRVAHDAYLMETQAQREIEQRVIMGADLGHQWFA